jgi:flagellar protein FlaF
MGFETAAVIAIFFVSAVLIGTTAYTVISASEERIDEATNLKHEMQVKRLQTDLSITNTTTDNSSGTYNLTVTVSNSGSVTLDSDKLNVLINGTMMSYSTSSPDIWTPDKIRNFTINNISKGSASEHRVKVTTENGISDYATYPI